MPSKRGIHNQRILITRPCQQVHLLYKLSFESVINKQANEPREINKCKMIVLIVLDTRVSRPTWTPANLFAKQQSVSKAVETKAHHDWRSDP